MFAVGNAVVANGTATVRLGPGAPRERWAIASTTVTGLNATVTISYFGRVVDSTANDPRPTITSDTAYDVGPGTQIVVTWTGLPNGTPVQATVTGTRQVGHDAV